MTKRELLKKLDSKELSEWMAYSRIEPIGEYRKDLRAGIIASVVANGIQSFGDKKGKDYKPEDFMPEFGEEKQEKSPEELKKKWENIVKAMGGET